MSFFAHTAATLVVSEKAGVGDYTTVAQALLALPAAGGCILVRDGTYALTTTNTMPDKPVVIRGCGEGTIFSLGANAIAAFTIPNGLTAQRQYVFEDFKVTGTSIANQRILDISDSNAFGLSVLQRLRSEGVQIPINITTGDGAFLTPVFVSCYDSWFVPIAAGTGVLCDSNGISNLMNVSFYNTKFIVDSFSTVGGTINNDSFGNLDVAFYDCELSLTGEDAFSTIHAERTRIFNFSGTPQITFINGNFVSDDYVPQSHFINCNVLGMWLIDSSGTNATGGWWVNDRIETGGNNTRSAFVGVAFHGDGFSAATWPVSLGITTFFGNSGGDVNVEGCTFSTFSIAPSAYIYTDSDFVIKGCAFRGLTVSSTAGIRFNGPNNFVIGCDFDTDNWGCPPILEVGINADRNVYNDNLGINGNPNPLVGGTGVDSVFVGTRNTFNGLSQFRGTAATTDAFVTVNVQRATSGVQGIGTIKNTGANSMNVRRTGIDQFGVTDTATTTVTAGNDMPLDPTVNIGTARPPYSSYRIEVQSTVAGNATTYVVRLGMNGEVTW